MSEAEPHSKAEMMALVHRRWAELQQLADSLTPAQLEQPLGDGWSAKVHLGHIAGWERSLLALLRGQDRIAAMGLTTEGDDVEGINQPLAELTLRLPLAEVRADSAAVHAEVVALLESMSEDDLAKPYSHYQPNDTPPESRPVFSWVNGNTWGHYEEHIGWLRAGLQQQ